MPLKLSTVVHTHSCDNGDGSGSVWVFGTEAEAIQSKRERMDGDDLTDEEVLADDDDYEHGTLHEERMNFELSDDGQLTLIGYAHFETGNQ